MVAVDGEEEGGRWRLGEVGLSTTVTVSSSSHPALRDEGKMATLSQGLDSNEGERRWPTTTSRDGGCGSESRGERCAQGGGENGVEDFSTGVSARDKVCSPCAAAATGSD
jgi:hypothetical protein